MNKKQIIGGVLVTAITLSATLSGCSLISTNSEANLTQTIAEVNVTKAKDFDTNASDYVAYKSAIGTHKVIKRDLIAYFLNTGYSMVEQGYSYSDVFNMLVQSLTETELLTQYATLYLLKDISTYKNIPAEDVISTYNAKATYSQKYEYLLTETRRTGEVNRVILADYALCAAVNGSLDSYEEVLLEEEDETAGTSDTRTTPTGVDTEQETYYPKKTDESLNYGIYTGYEGYFITDSGAYQDDKLTGSNNKTRANAYNNFIRSLKSNFLVEDGEDITDVKNLSYIQLERENQLKVQVIEQYYDLYEAELESTIMTDEYLHARYNGMLEQQKIAYATDTAFTTAMDGMAKDKFLLYSPSTTDLGGGSFGFVYNILLPFSQSQNVQLAELTKLKGSEDISVGRFYELRSALLANIKTTDQREAWFNGTTDYSFNAKELSLDYYDGGNSNRTHLFFENNLTNAGEGKRYETLEKYAGQYSYNGTVVEGSDGKYVLIPQQLTIDNMLAEFKAYVEYVLGTPDAVTYATESDYVTTAAQVNEDDIDYSKFIYASGKVNLTDNSLAGLLIEDSDQYKALSAVNELQYAYTTDVGILTKHVGYSVSAFSTSYIKEFEAAAHEAINNGAGSFNVCAGDYGWHLIYVTATFGEAGGDVYEVTDASYWTTNKEIKGSFANMFFEYVKESDLSNASSTRRSQLIATFGGDTSIVLHKDTYKELLELDS